MEIDLTEPIDLYYKWTEALINLNEGEGNSDDDLQEDNYGETAGDSDDNNEDED